MNIKRSIQFSLKKRTYKDKEVLENLPIRMRISYNSVRLDILTGYSIDSDKWDADAQRVKKGYYNKKRESYSDINSYLNKAAYEMEESFKEFEIVDRIPTRQELEEAFDKRMQGKTSIPKIKKKSKFFEALQEFKRTESIKNSWQYSTIQKFDAMENHIKAYKPQPRFEDFNDRGLTQYVVTLREKEDLSNETILKQLGYLKWFLKWAAANKYHNVMDYEHYKPHLATTDKKVIFLTIEEIRTLIATVIPPEKQYLERVRDVFVFCCFTGLRHSDVYNLRRSDVKDDHIEVTTKKTADSLVIDLNDVSKKILEKYKDVDFPEDKVLPVISNQKMNDYLKELCKIAGFNEEIRITTYKGSERIDQVFPKYELIGTHQGRKSFICNALAAGVPVNVVMKWTGHSDYKAMKPYIDVADSIKAREMNKLNNLL